MRTPVIVIAAATSAAATTWLLGEGITTATRNAKGAWTLGRAAGITSYLLLVALVLTGLLLAHSSRARGSWPGPATRLRLHASLAAFTLVFTVLHIIVLATDPYAGLGWSGALLPLASTYRPLPVTLGVLGLWSGGVAGLTAALAGRGAGRVWFPIHKVAGVSLVLAWVHGVTAGSDSPGLLGLYWSSAVLVVATAVSRYTRPRPHELVGALS